MLSKAQIKYIRSLTQQKYRNEHKVFIAEGVKIAAEWLESDEKIQYVVASESWVASNIHLLARHPEAQLLVADELELASVSGLQTPNQVLLTVHLRQATIPLFNSWTLALDAIQDPGNMGTLIRIADWFGIKDVVCSPGCADVYNPKVVQAAMGGHLRVNIVEMDLSVALANAKIPVIVAALDGDNVYHLPRMACGVLVIGNESKGVSEQIKALATRKVLIPRRGGAESLNAAVSSGILCSLLMPV